MRRGLAAAALAASAMVLGPGCGGDGDGQTVVSVKVELAHRPADGLIVLLKATVKDERRNATREFARADRRPLTFPTAFGIELGPDVVGPISIDVDALDAGGTLLARGSIPSQVVMARRTQNTRLWLECAGRCGADGGATDGPGPDAPRDAGGDAPPGGDAMATCGNGVREPGEDCDIGISRGQQGACPPATCDDDIACTTDTRLGTGCNARCEHEEISDVVAGDMCCPANATHLTDPDCSATCGNGRVDPGETCDLGIARGAANACPAVADCADSNPCTRDSLLSAGTCSARCQRAAITALVNNDGCCPAGATQTTDSDCPVVCGNGTKETGELCDPGVTVGADACRTGCRDDDACTIDVLVGSGCQTACRQTVITELVGGDGCCPRGGNRNVDPDCLAECGNGVTEPGEMCDRAIPAGRPGACPTTCAPGPSRCVPGALKGSAADCSARCVPEQITGCGAQPDGCCASGCTAANDPDCSNTCGNGIKEDNESCDTAIAESLPGACRRRCDDGNSCTDDVLLSSGTCHAACFVSPITSFRSGDGCCPPGGNHNLDGDCPVVCGNGVLEGPDETCDRAIAAGAAGACPATCPPTDGCRRQRLEGDAATCTARCTPDPIATCRSGDGCCPPGCNRNNDGDCASVCGNGVREPGEECDRGITAGNTDACPASCDDGDPCTNDSTSGRVADCNRICSYTRITACAAGDCCCPAGCSEATDGDCSPRCGNGIVEARETCDLPSTCPTTCVDDGDRCTEERLSGTALMCNVACSRVPLTTCSGSTGDGCCPTGCVSRPGTTNFDTDCTGSAPLPPVP